MSKYLLNGRAYRYLSPLDVYYAWYIYHVYCAWQKTSSGDSQKLKRRRNEISNDLNL